MEKSMTMNVPQTNFLDFGFLASIQWIDLLPSYPSHSFSKSLTFYYSG